MSVDPIYIEYLLGIGVAAAGGMILINLAPAIGAAMTAMSVGLAGLLSTLTLRLGFTV